MPEMSPLSEFSWEKIIFAFFGRRAISYIHICNTCKYTKYIIFPCIFLRRIIFHFLCKKISPFREKEISFFQILQKYIYIYTYTNEHSHTGFSFIYIYIYIYILRNIIFPFMQYGLELLEQRCIEFKTT